MVKGRMNRESNPIPGEVPGFTPQYKNSDGTFTDVTPETPYPVIDSQLVERLNRIEQKVDAILEGTRPANTILKESIIGKRLFEGVISPGGFREMYVDIIYPYFKLLIVPSSSTSFEIFEGFRDVKGQSFDGYKRLIDAEVRNHYLTEKKEALTNKYRFRVYNRGEDALDFRIDIFYFNS